MNIHDVVTVLFKIQEAHGEMDVKIYDPHSDDIAPLTHDNFVVFDADIEAHMPTYLVLSPIPPMVFLVEDERREPYDQDRIS